MPAASPALKPPSRLAKGGKTGMRMYSNVFTDPASDSAEQAARLLRARLSPLGGRGAVGESEMDQTRGGGEGRSPGRFGQPLDAQRTAYADLLVENVAGQFARARQLAGAAGQHHAAPGRLVEARGDETVAHQLEGLLDARRDDSDQDRFRHVVGVAFVFLAHQRHGDGLALVGG